MKVMRWERKWQAAGQPFYDVTAYPEVSVATSGTHDTETMADWWANADLQERRALLAMPLLRAAGLSSEAPFSDHVRDALLDALFAAGSRLLILPLQDILGWRDRINTPAQVNDQNWTWRLPGPVEDLVTDRSSIARAGFLRALAQKHRRLPAAPP
jgi:4-alpha-glucanotransferase